VIIYQEIKIKIHTKNKKRLSLKYGELSINKIILGDISDLSKSSHVELDVKCDVCGKEKKLSYKEYNNSYKKK